MRAKVVLDAVKDPDGTLSHASLVLYIVHISV